MTTKIGEPTDEQWEWYWRGKNYQELEAASKARKLRERANLQNSAACDILLPMANEFRGTELEKTIHGLINQHGMENLLRAVIESTKPLEVYGEKYITVLLRNLKTTLYDYESRYSDENERKLQTGQK